MPPERKSQPRNPELAALAIAIQERMDERGLNQKALAEASGIDIRRIGDYVRGQFNPNLPNLRKLCKALDLTADALMERAHELEGEPPEG